MKDWLRANPGTSGGDAVGVDRKAGVIRGYVVAELGVFRDRRGEFTEKSLSKVVELGNQPNKGLKVRFTHPNSSNDGLGTYLGRARNFRLDGDKVRADMHLAEVAKATPRHGNLHEYILSLAESDPDAFATSLVLRADKKFRRDEDGALEVDEEGEPLPPIWTPTSLHASDVVDEGAATSSFLSADDELQPAELATRYLDGLFEGKGREYVEGHLSDFAARYILHSFGEKEMTQEDKAADLRQGDMDAIMAKLGTLADGLSALTGRMDAQEAREKDARDRASQISSLCELAGHADLSSEMIDSELSILDVQAKLLAIRKEQQQLSRDEGQKGGDKYVKYRAEYLETKKIHDQLGVTVEEYIEQRCEEDGKPAPAWD